MGSLGGVEDRVGCQGAVRDESGGSTLRCDTGGSGLILVVER